VEGAACKSRIAIAESKSGSKSESKGAKWSISSYSHPKPSPSRATESVRSFPRSIRSRVFIFFDNAAGAQIPQVVFDAVNGHLLHCNVQRGGRYAKSMEVDASIARARESVAASSTHATPTRLPSA
jgi:hypothetical protein